MPDEYFLNVKFLEDMLPTFRREKVAGKKPIFSLYPERKLSVMFLLCARSYLSIFHIL
jgi:hypothetical protein